MADAKFTISAEDDSQAAFASVVRSLGGLHQAAEEVRGVLEAVGVTISADYFVDLVKGAIETGDHLSNLNKTTNVSVEHLAGLSLLAKQSGTDLDGLAKGVARLQVEIGKAPDKFRELGITAKDGVGALKQFSDVFSQLPDINQRNALSQAVFNRSWQDMAPILTLGSEKIQTVIERGTELSSMTTAQARASEELNGKIAELTATHGFLNQQLQTALPLLTAVADTLIELRGKGQQADQDAFHPLAETLRALIVLGGNVSFVLHGVGNELGSLVAGLAAGGPFTAAGRAIHNLAVNDAAAAREAFDKWERSIMSTKTALQGVGDTSDALSRRLAVSARDEQAAIAARAANFLKSQQAAQDAAAGYDGLIKRINEKIALDKAQIEAGRPLADEEKFEAKVNADLIEIKKKYPAASKAVVDAKLAEIRVSDLKVRIQNSELETAKQVAQQRQDLRNKDYVDSDRALKDIQAQYAGELKSINDNIQSLKDEADADVLAATANITLAEAVNRVAIARLQERQSRTVEGSDAYQSLQQEIEAREKLNGLLRDKATYEDAKRSVQELGNLGRQLWDDLWSSGHDKLQRLGGDIEKFLLNELYKLVEREWVIPIIAQVTGTPLSTAMAATSGAPSLLGNALGLNKLFGFGGASTAASTVAPMSEYAGVASTSVGAAAAGGAGIMGTIGAALPYVGLALVAGQALGLFGSSHGPKTESGVSSGFGDVAQRGDPTAANSIIAGIQSLFAGAAGAIGLKTTALPVGAFVSQDPNGTALTQLQIQSANYNRGTEYGGIENVGRSDAQLQAAELRGELEDVFTELKAEIGKEGLTGQLADLVKSIDPATASVDDMSAALKKLQDVGSFDQAVGALGSEFSNLTSLTVDAKEALIAGAGGLQNFTTELTAFNNDFTTAAEKQDATWKSLVATFTAANVVLPSTRDAFRQAVDTATAIGDVKSLQTLLGAEQAFNQLYPAIDSTAAAASGATKAMDDWQTAYFKSWASTGDAATKSAQATSAAWGEVFSGMRDSFGALMGSISDKVAQIRGDLVSNPVGVSLASAQANFNSLIAQVSAGGSGSMAAARQLGDASTLLLNVAQNSGMEALPLSLLKAKTAQALANVQPAIGRQNAADSKSVALAYWNSTGGDAGSAYASPRAGAGGSGFSDASVVHIREMSRRLSDLHSVMSRQQEMLGDLLNGRQRAPLSVTVV